MRDGFYIELISFWTDDHDAQRRYGLLQKGGGLIEFMLTSDDIEADIVAANGRLPLYANPTPGSRIRPDGIEVSWIDGPTSATTAAIPSLIQDVTNRALRVPAGNARRHANGILGLERLVLAVTNLEQAVDKYRALLGRMPEPGKIVGTAVFSIGSHYIVLQEPPADSEMAAHLATFGDSPYAVEFYGAQSNPSQDNLGGARISVK